MCARIIDFGRCSVVILSPVDIYDSGYACFILSEY